MFLKVLLTVFLFLLTTGFAPTAKAQTPTPNTAGQVLYSPNLRLPGVNTSTKIFPLTTKLGGFISSLFEVVILIAVILSFFWLVWGAFHYLFAGGNKEELAKARGRITWAIVGLILVLVAFLIAQFTVQIFGPKGGTPIG